MAIGSFKAWILGWNGVSRVAVVLWAGTVWACDDDTSGSADGGADVTEDSGSDSTNTGDTVADSSSDVDPLCEAVCQHQDECHPEDDDLEQCLSECSCYADLYRADGLEAQFTCQADLACDDSRTEDDCIREAAEEVGTTPTYDAYLTACTNRRAECDDAFNNDYCDCCEPAPIIMQDDIVSAMSDCLAESCEDIATCMDAAAAAEAPLCF